MYDLDETAKVLGQVLQSNFDGPNKDLWSVYYQFWRYFYCLNQNIEESLRLEDKVTLIADFTKQHKHLKQFTYAQMDRKKIKLADVPAFDSSIYPLHIQSMKDMLTREENRLKKHMKEIQKERIPHKQGRKKGPKRADKENWIRT